MIYKCGNEADFKELIKLVRNKPLDREIVQCKFGKLTLNVTRARALLHFRIYDVLTLHNLPIDKPFVCYEGYDKKHKFDWIKRCVEYMKNNSKFDYFNKNPIILSQITSRLMECYNFLGLVVDMVLGIDHSIFSYVEEYKNNPKFRYIMDNQLIEADMPVEEVEKRCKELIELFNSGEIPLHPLDTLIRSGCNINNDQLRSLIVRGLVPEPTEDRRLYRIPITEGSLNGIKKKEHKFVEASIARKATLLSKSSIKKAGTLSKAITNAVQNVKINDTITRSVIHDCNTTHLAKIFISNQNKLKQLIGKYMMTDFGLKAITGNEEDLIGKTISIRSITKCAGDTICETCFGKYAYANQDHDGFKYNFGALVGTIMVADGTQIILSAKHYTSGIALPVILLIDGQRINIINCKWIQRKYDHIIFTNVKGVYAKYKDINISNNKDYYYINKLQILDNEDKLHDVIFPAISQIEIPIHENNENILLDVDKEDLYKLESEDIRYLIPNKSVTNKYDTLNDIKGAKYIDLIPKTEVTADMQVDWVLNYLGDRLSEYHIIDIESVIRGLTRDKNNERLQPNWTLPNPELIFITADSAKLISKSPSVSRILHNGYIPRTLLSISSETVQACEYDIIYNCIKPRKLVLEPFSASIIDVINKNIEANKNLNK